MNPIPTRIGGGSDDVGGQIWRSSSMACISRKPCREPWLVEKKKGCRGTTGKKVDKNYFMPQLPATGGGEPWLAERRNGCRDGSSFDCAVSGYIFAQGCSGQSGWKELLTLTSHDLASGGSIRHGADR